METVTKVVAEVLLIIKITNLMIKHSMTIIITFIFPVFCWIATDTVRMFRDKTQKEL